ncbi:MAG: DNA topoisomerase IV subunit A [Planctomycetes bacterium]|nr:DNA topoisomerase IV subunit A [Planctomycetota bacterium]
MANIEPLMEGNFLEYASYVIIDRAIPDVRDGCKPVQRRILQTMHGMDDGKFNKVANVIGETMKLHPHGDMSIGDALVVLANKNYFIERQGNFGNPITGHKAAAARYIECRLTPLARENLFNKHLTEFQPSYDGRKQEPIFLPAKLPVILMLGTEGIAVGMATKIMSHNFIELLNGQIQILNGEEPSIYPDFTQGGLMDAAEYEDGAGKIKLRARIEPSGDKKVVIKEIPFSTTTESVIASIESAVGKGRVKISGISDFTTDTVEIELNLARGIYADEVIPQLYAYTDCEVSISSNIVLIREKRPIVLTVGELLRDLTKRLKDTLRRELEWELEQLQNKQHWLTLEQIFIENRVYKRIEEAKTEEAVYKEVYTGMNKFKKLFIRDINDDDVKRLLEIRIRRISAYDINKTRKDIDDIIKAIKAINTRLKNMKKTTVGYLKDLIKKYAGDYPRRTEICTFTAIDKKEVARSNIKVSYDPKSGFFGSSIKGDEKFNLTLSEFDRVLIISKDGAYRICSPDEKILISAKPVYYELYDQEKGIELTVLFRDKKKNAFAKKIQLLKFTRNREYELIKKKEGRIDEIIIGDAQNKVSMEFVPAKHQKLKSGKFNLKDVEFQGASARGVRMAPKPVSKIKLH